MAFTKRKKPFKKHIKRHKRHAKAAYKTIALTCPYRGGNMMLPDTYRAVGHTNYIQAIQSGAASTETTQIIIIAFNDKSNQFNKYFWNGTNWTSSTANIQPAGLFYLLGDPDRSGVGQGGNAPYLRGRVNKSTIKVRWIPTQDGTHPVSSRICVFPTNSDPRSTLAGIGGVMNLGTLSEQPYCKTFDFPWQTTTMAKPMINSIGTLKLMGDRFRSSIESGEFDFEYDTTPAYELYWVVSVTTIGANAAYYVQSGTLEIDMFDHIELFNRNPLLSSSPA